MHTQIQERSYNSKWLEPRDSQTSRGLVSTSADCVVGERSGRQAPSTLARMSKTNQLILVLSLMVLGCKGNTNDVKSEASMQVMSLYAEFYNETIDDICDLIEDHFKNLPSNDEPITVAMLGAPGVWTVCSGVGWRDMDRNEANEALQAAKEGSSGKFKDLPPLADAMWEAANKINSTRKEFCVYFKAEDYKDDDAAKANAFNKQMIAAAGDWQTSSAALSDALGAFEDEQTLAQIKKYEKDKSYSYWFRHFNYMAKQVIRGGEQGPDALVKAITEIEAEHATFKTFVAAQAKLAPAFDAYVDSTERFMAEAKKARRDLGEAKDDEKKAKIINNKMDSIIGAYNSLVGMHNTLSELEANDLLK